MYKRSPYLALAILSLAFAVSLRAGPLGAVVVSWDIDSTENTVTLHILNNSGKDITFFNISIKETYGQNINEHQFSREMPDISILIQDPSYFLAQKWHFPRPGVVPDGSGPCTGVRWCCPGFFGLPEGILFSPGCRTALSTPPACQNSSHIDQCVCNHPESDPPFHPWVSPIPAAV